jgi:protein-arginine kinase activator protein McsA
MGNKGLDEYQFGGANRVRWLGHGSSPHAIGCRMMAEFCDICRQKPAKNHLCQIAYGEKTLLDLCEECFQAHQARMGVEMPRFDGTQRCYYCGSPAQSCSMNQQWEQSVRGQRFHYTCLRCAELQYQFFMQALDAMPKGLSTDKQMDAITRAISESDSHVRKRLQDTKS